jgi:hypothetical protein
MLQKDLRLRKVKSPTLGGMEGLHFPYDLACQACIAASV